LRLADDCFLRDFPAACFAGAAGLSVLPLSVRLFLATGFSPGDFFLLRGLREAAFPGVLSLASPCLSLPAFLVSASSVAVLPITASGKLLAHEITVIIPKIGGCFNQRNSGVLTPLQPCPDDDSRIQVLAVDIYSETHRKPVLLATSSISRLIRTRPAPPCTGDTPPAGSSCRL
jgi:hypothetical protein